MSQYLPSSNYKQQKGEIHSSFMSAPHFATPSSTPPKATNLHLTLPIFQIERQYPHSTLNLKTKVKFSPTIYKYQNYGTIKASSRSDCRPNSQISKRFCSLTTFNLNQLLQKSLTTVEGKNRKTLKVQRNNSHFNQKKIKNSQYYAHSELRMPSRDYLFNDSFRSSQKFEVDDDIPAKNKLKGTIGLYSSRKTITVDKKVCESGQNTSRSRRKSSLRFMPWDLQSGFGKSKRF